MLTGKTFETVLKAATELDPYGKKLSDETIAMAYLTLPDSVKRQVTDDMFIYCFRQLQLDSAQRSELTLIQQLLQHVFRCENGAPSYQWGLKTDLAGRMANPGVFHGQPKGEYLLGQAEGKEEPRFAATGVLAQLGAFIDD